MLITAVREKVEVKVKENKLCHVSNTALQGFIFFTLTTCFGQMTIISNINNQPVAEITVY